MESNWKFKSLQNLEKKPATAIEYSTNLVERCSKLFNQPLNEYSVEDMRIMISQQIGLNYLIPLALEQLNTDILSEGDYYPGDLLTAILKVDKPFWSKNDSLLLEVTKLVETNKELLFQAEIPLDLLESIA